MINYSWYKVATINVYWIHFQFTFYVCLFFSGKSRKYFFSFSIIRKCYWTCIFCTPASVSFCSCYNIKQTPIVINPNNNRSYDGDYPAAVSNTLIFISGKTSNYFLRKCYWTCIFCTPASVSFCSCYNIKQTPIVINPNNNRSYDGDYPAAVSNTLIFISGKTSNYFLRKCYWTCIFCTPASVSFCSCYNIKQTPIVINPNNNRSYDGDYPAAVSNTLIFISGKTSNYFLRKCYWTCIFCTPASVSFCSCYNIKQTPIVINPNNNRSYDGDYPAAVSNTLIFISGKTSNYFLRKCYWTCIFCTPASVSFCSCYNIKQTPIVINPNNNLSYAGDHLVAVSNTVIFINSSNFRINQIFSRNFTFVSFKWRQAQGSYDFSVGKNTKPITNKRASFFTRCFLYTSPPEAKKTKHLYKNIIFHAMGTILLLNISL